MDKVEIKDPKLADVVKQFNIDVNIKNTQIKLISPKDKWNYFKEYFNDINNKTIVEHNHEIIFNFGTSDEAENFSKTGHLKLLNFVREKLKADGKNSKEYQINFDFSNIHEPNKTTVRFILL